MAEPVGLGAEVTGLKASVGLAAGIVAEVTGFTVGLVVLAEPASIVLKAVGFGAVLAAEANDLLGEPAPICLSG
ncbi:hypothetical protein TIFTF001_048339 [Ficus carica]|uniref:Uncharacterized protein n=1 Tax=Ficus carica TaxID=3494 RepID=A0AA87ZJM5_FICCA|nr:hypothetical protein TIFTF001_048321 [Ficus carica]GMN34190.1 hypothetical protein TIFTF001_048329 [Ficus carica]GMN34215.1 hypothetical protein TIFTF001_048331 [Ficus carica]GMN34233.1 hypothetical protein TIFTF001_048339 [Ficus carica]